MDKPNTMEFLADYAYDEQFIPPRCRKPRTREITGTCTVTIPSISLDMAPVAMWHKSCWQPNIVVYRWYKGQLYTRSLFRKYFSGADGYWPLNRLKASFRGPVPQYLKGHNEADCCERCQNKANRYLILAGDQVWERVGEPRYVVMTFGLGHNHASTALMIDNLYNENIRGDFYFNALDRKKAIQKCLEVARARGDTASFDSIRNSDEIRVLMPEAVLCKPEVEAGPGNDFLNQLEFLTEISSSEEEAAILAIAAALK